MNPELRKKIGQYKADKLKQDLPEYKDGGKKIAAGLAGFAKNIPMLGQVIDPLVANTDAVKDNPVAYASGNLVGSTAKTIGMGIVNPMSLASNVPQTIGAGLNVGSAVATEKGNLDTAQGLNTASTALSGLGSQAGQLTSMFGNLGENAGGNIPVVMKNGGMIKRADGSYSRRGLWDNIRANKGSGKEPTKEMLEQERKIKANKKEDGGWLDGYESTITRLPNNMAAWSYKDGGSLINFKGPKHEDGGIPIDNNMKVNPFNAIAEVEGEETADPKQNYIFSDTLKPMNTKRTFAEISKSIDNKYKNNEDPIATKSKERELERLAQSNEEVRLAKEAKNNPLKMKNGGNLPKYEKGNYFNPYGLGSGAVDTFGTNHVEDANTMTPSFALDTTTIPSIMERSNKKAPVANTAAITSANSNQQFTTGDYMQLGAGALTGITNLAMGLKKPEKFNPITSSYMDSGLADMNQNVRFNTNPILMNRNVGANQINQSSTSDAVRRANLQSLFRGTNTQLGEMAEKEALANVGIKQQLGQAKIGVGAQDIASQEKARGLNIQAKATAQNLRAQGLEDIYGSIGEVGKGMNVRQGNTIKLNVLNSLASQYGIDPKTLEIIFKNQGITTTK